MTRKRRSQRLRRVDEVVRQVVADALLEQNDQRVRAVVVTGVEVSADTAYADVYVQLAGNDHRRERSLEALEKVRPRIQARVNEEMHLRLTPVLRFRIDETFDHAMRIERLLAENPPLPEQQEG